MRSRRWIALFVLPSLVSAILVYSIAQAFRMPSHVSLLLAALTLGNGVAMVWVMLRFTEEKLKSATTAMIRIIGIAEEKDRTLQEGLAALRQRLKQDIEEDKEHLGNLYESMIKREEERVNQFIDGYKELRAVMIEGMAGIENEKQQEIDALEARLRRNVGPDAEWARSELRNGRAYEEVQAEYLIRQNVDLEDAAAVKQAKDRLYQNTKTVPRV